MIQSMTLIALAFALTAARLPNTNENVVSAFMNNTSYILKQTSPPGTLCQMAIDNRSVAFFRSRLALDDFQLAHFSIRFNTSKRYNSTQETFQPNKWVWTYRTPGGLNPFLYWNIDYSVLSFGLLSAKTLKSKMFILFNVPDNCDITFGTPETTKSIALAIRDATNGVIKSGALTNPKYESSYYCYLAEAPKARESVSYIAAIYFMYPISYINYNCCVVAFNYTWNNVTAKCLDHQIEKWPQCTLGPYIIGIIMFLFYPILYFRVCAWVANDEMVEPAASVSVLQLPIQVNQEDNVVEIDETDDNWLYLDGQTPFTMTDILTHLWCGLDKTWPIVISRLRRLFLLIASPIGIYVQIIVYNNTMKHEVELLVKHGTPIGFLSLLGSPQDRVHVFARVFGGPEGICVLYFVLGMLLLVVPRSVQQIYEDSIRPPSFCFKTPLSLSLTDIKHLSTVNQPLVPGYQNVISLLKCSIYMLFSKQYWKWVLKTQIERVRFSENQPYSKLAYVFRLVAMPLYIILCILEILICIFLFGFPLFMCAVLTLRGATRSMIKFRRYLMQFCRSSILRKIFFENHLVKATTILLVAAVVIMFVYVVCLIFIETFAFLSQVIVFCFVAVIVYPSVAFGYLFYFVVLVYYIFRRIREFGDGYLELLSDAVDISRNLEGQPNYITFYGDNIVMSNVKAPRGIKGIQVNGTSIEVAANVFNDTQNRQRLKIVKNKYGIPKDLFSFLVKRHRPAHQQVLKIVLNIILIFCLIGLTLSISSKYITGPSSDISEVMHVVFIVGVGALPRVLEVALMNASASIKKEIKLRNLEQSVLAYWNEVASNN